MAAAMALRRVSFSIKHPIRPFFNHMVLLSKFSLYPAKIFSFLFLLPSIFSAFSFLLLIDFSFSPFFVLPSIAVLFAQRGSTGKGKGSCHCKPILSHCASSYTTKCICSRSESSGFEKVVFRSLVLKQGLFHGIQWDLIQFVLYCKEIHTKKFWLQWIKQLNDPLEAIDPEIADIIELEKARQWKVPYIDRYKILCFFQFIFRLLDFKSL